MTEIGNIKNWNKFNVVHGEIRVYGEYLIKLGVTEERGQLTSALAGPVRIEVDMEEQSSRRSTSSPTDKIDFITER